MTTKSTSIYKEFYDERYNRIYAISLLKRQNVIKLETFKDDRSKSVYIMFDLELIKNISKFISEEY